MTQHLEVEHGFCVCGPVLEHDCARLLLPVVGVCLVLAGKPPTALRSIWSRGLIPRPSSRLTVSFYRPMPKLATT